MFANINITEYELLNLLFYMNYSELINPLKVIALNAGNAIMEIYQDPTNFGVEQKADDSPLTKADSAANKIICDGLESLAIQYPIISEENKAVPYEVRKEYNYFWLVDPLDGTKEFIKRNGEFTVNIALIENGTPVMGVVYAPVLEEMYWAVSGQGAFCERKGNVEKLSANNFQWKDAGLRLVCSRSHLNEQTQQFVDHFENPELVSKGSSLKFLLLADQQADIYPRLAPTMEWDTGAAHIVLKEAGGEVINAETRQPLEYNKEVLLNPHFVAMGQTDPTGIPATS